MKNKNVFILKKKKFDKSEKNILHLSFTISMFLLVVGQVSYPLIVNAQEPVDDIKEKIVTAKSYEVTKEGKTATGNYATNVAYGKDDEEAQEQGTGVIQTDGIGLNNINYKINAMTHEVIVYLSTDKDLYNDGYNLELTIEDESIIKKSITIEESNTETDEVPGYMREIGDKTDDKYEYEISTGSLEDEGYKADGIYKVGMTNTSKTDGTIVDIVEIPGTTNNIIEIQVPKIVKYGEKTYASIGDQINGPTDIADAFGSDKIEPGDGSATGSGTSTTPTYGIYELESIGYEEANDRTSTISTSVADWTESDLTLSKYDHVIRPIDGNYLIESNIDATLTNETTPKLDKEGGWSSDSNTDGDNVVNIADTNDGYRPIGQTVGSPIGDDYEYFTGEITGDIDVILGDDTLADNTYVSNIYINSPEKYNLGLVGLTSGATINDLGIIKPSIIGYGTEGAFVGNAVDTSFINVYTLDDFTEGTTEYEIIGTSGSIGGIAGSVTNSEIKSTGTFKGEIPGVELAGVEEPDLNLPDKDGYKTFNTLDVQTIQGYQIGGLVGGTNYVEIDKVYNKGEVYNKELNAGGLVGSVDKNDIIKNSYNMGKVISEAGFAAGILANSNNLETTSIEISNVYNSGEIIGSEGAAGIIYDYQKSNVINAINTGNLKVDGGNIGGVAGDTNTTETSEFKNIINLGGLDGSIISTGGVVGGLVAAGGLGSVNVTNGLNVGEVSIGAEGTYYSVAGTTVGVTNTYASKSINEILADGNAGQVGVEYVDEVELNDETWWQEVLFGNDATNYNNFNIKAGDAVIPSPDIDSEDESYDNNLGTVSIGKYPTVKEIDEEGVATNLEVLEQGERKIPVIKRDIDYKIDAQTLDIYLKLSMPDSLSKSINGDIVINDGTSDVLSTSVVLSSGEQIVTIENTGWEDGNIDVGVIKPNQDYTIIVSYNDGASIGEIKIHTPKQVEYNGKTYASIGDGVNIATDVEDGFGSDKIEPGDGNLLVSGTATTTNYGIYELESIGYEEANATDWSEDDLTLAKYDHIIRPIDGNYLITSNIDASVTNETTPKLDKEGGWSSDSNTDGDNIINVADTNDGYRPIGQVIGSTGDGTTTYPGDDAIQYRGEITGDIDVILGDETLADNSVITNIYINDATVDNIGIIGKTENAYINNIGIVDPMITGNSKVGSLVGEANGKVGGAGVFDGYTQIENVYTIDTDDETSSIEAEIKSMDTRFTDAHQGAGGIVGEGYNTKIVSTGRFKGEIPGIELAGEVQPNTKLPDKDGYKTFNMIDIENSNLMSGGIVGYLENGQVNKVYNKGGVKSENTAGGIVGEAQSIEVYNAYNLSNDFYVEFGNVGGIIGYVRPTEGITTIVKNVVNNGDITLLKDLGSKGYTIGGIVGAPNSTQIENAINNGDITAEYWIGGIIGNIGDANEGIIKNVINTGDVEAKGVIADIEGESGYNAPAIGGIAGDFTATPGSMVTNALNVGDVSATYPDVNEYSTGAIVGSIKVEAATYFNNVFYNNTIQVLPEDYTSSSYSGISETNIIELNDETWWQEVFFGNDATNYNNFNIKIDSASIPNPDIDSEDESLDDNLGTVERGYYPTIKETDGTSPVSENTEVPEQEVQELDKIVRGVDYKINAQTLDISLKLNAQVATTRALEGKVVVNDGTEDILEDTFEYVDGSQEVKVENIGWTDGNIGAGIIKPDQDYTLTITYNEGVKVGEVKIHTPKQVQYNGKTYGLIGDGVNKATDVLGGVESDKIEPGDGVEAGTVAKYGIYELESIGYEEANGADIDSDSTTPNVTDWSEDDLTLAKYDHIIRPIDGNYLIASNIDATVTNETTPKLDKEGGWSSDSNTDGDNIINVADTNDGYRPIGQVQSSVDGKDVEYFTGEITGNVDDICGASNCTNNKDEVMDYSNTENTYISDMYINLPTIEYVGIVGYIGGGHINDLGSIDPQITGYISTGAIAGSLRDVDLTDSDISGVNNVYAIREDMGIEYNITGNNTATGGLIGSINNATITSDTRFKGEIPGIELTEVGQPDSKLPDKDGYKTFNTLTVNGRSYATGGIVGATYMDPSYKQTKIDKVYNKGDVIGESNAGGIAGAGAGQFYNVYNTGHITSEIGVAAGIFANSNDLIDYINTSKIKNSYNTGHITGWLGAAGIVGDYQEMDIENVINTGSVEALGTSIDSATGGPVSIYAAGILGNISDDGAAISSAATLTNAINFGEIKVTSDNLGLGTKPAGIEGSGAPIGGPIIRNTLNVGILIPSSKVGTYLSIGDITGADIQNSYALNGINDNTIDENYGQAGITYVESVQLADSTWWTDSLGLDGNWNVNESDASQPLEDGDTLDESSDDGLGTIPQGYYPTIKETDGTNPISENTEVPEQVPELFSLPRSIGTQIIKDEDVVYPVMTDSISGLATATESQMNIYNSLKGSDGIVTYSEVESAGYSNYVLNPDEFVNGGSVIDESGKYLNHEGFNFIATGVEWDYDDTNNGSYALEQSIERNPEVLVDDITLKTTISLPSTYEVTGVDIRKINKEGIVEADIGNMIGYFSAPNSLGGMDIYVRIRPDYYFSDMDQYVVKSITYDKIKDNDGNSADDTTITLWNDLNSNNQIDTDEGYSDLYSVDGYGNITNNDADGSGVIDNGEVSDGIADNQTLDTREMYKGVYTCKNTDTNMNDYTIGSDNIYSKIHTDYETDIAAAYTNTPLSSLDTMYYYGFSWNDIRYYNNGSSFALQRNINCEDANRDGNYLENQATTYNDDKIAPIGNATHYLEDDTKESDSYAGSIDGQGYILSNITLASIISRERDSSYNSSSKYAFRTALITNMTAGEVKNLSLKNIYFDNEYGELYTITDQIDTDYDGTADYSYEFPTLFDTSYNIVTNDELINMQNSNAGKTLLSSNNNYSAVLTTVGSGNNIIDNVIFDGININQSQLTWALGKFGVLSDGFSGTSSNILINNINFVNEDSFDDMLASYNGIGIGSQKVSGQEYSNQLNNWIVTGNFKTDTRYPGLFYSWNGYTSDHYMNDIILDVDYENSSPSGYIMGDKSTNDILNNGLNGSSPDEPAGASLLGNNMSINENTSLNSVPIDAPTSTLGTFDPTNASNSWGIPLANYSTLSSSSTYSTWANWDATNVADGNYPKLKTNWGMLMEQADTPISDSLIKNDRETLGEAQEDLEEQKLDNLDSVDVGQMQQDSNNKGETNSDSEDIQDEEVLPEEETDEGLVDVTEDTGSNEEGLFDGINLGLGFKGLADRAFK